jgi:hypothetical protein
VDIADRTVRYFERVHREVFADDPAANPNLAVEVVATNQVEGVPILVLITPWTLNGMIFGDLPRFPPALTIGAKDYPVFENTLAELGPYRSVNLIADVSGLSNQDAARRAARAMVEPFRVAVSEALEKGQVKDGDRRDLLREIIKFPGKSAGRPEQPDD